MISIDLGVVRSKVKKHHITFPVDFISENFQIMYHNVRSLHAHIIDIRSDPNFTNADINIFSESKLCKENTDESVKIPGYSLYRHDFQKSNNARSLYGLAIYSKVPLSQDQIRKERKVFHSGGVVEIIWMFIKFPSHEEQTLNIMGVYISPKVSKDDLNNYLIRCFTNLSGPSVILGDFNIDHVKTNPYGILQNYRQCITNPTTDYNSLLDHIYTNMDQEQIRCGVFESYFSDHKPIWAELKLISNKVKLYLFIIHVITIIYLI